MTWLSMLNFTLSVPHVIGQTERDKNHGMARNSTKLFIITDDAMKSDLNNKKMMVEDDLVGFAWCEMAEAHAQLDCWDQAFQLWTDALQKQIEKYGKRSVLVVRTLRRRGNAYAQVGALFAAVTDLEQSVQLQKEIAENDDITALNDLANTLVELGNAQQKRQYYVEAMKHYQSALVLKEEILGDAHVDVAGIHLEIARAFQQRRRYMEAKRAHRKALQVYSIAGAPSTHPNIIRATRGNNDRNTIAHYFFEAALRVDDFGTI